MENATESPNDSKTVPKALVWGGGVVAAILCVLLLVFGLTFGCENTSMNVFAIGKTSSFRIAQCNKESISR